MKKTRLILFAFAAMVIAFSGCSKDDDFSMVGTWTQESSKFEINMGIPGMDGFTMEDNDPATIVFNADGTGTATDDEGTDTFNWSLSGNELSITDPATNFTTKLTLTTMTDKRVVGEQTLTQAELIAMGDWDEEDMEFFDNFPDLTAKMTIVLVR
jgi:hypothetical protein